MKYVSIIRTELYIKRFQNILQSCTRPNCCGVFVNWKRNVTTCKGMFEITSGVLIRNRRLFTNLMRPARPTTPKYRYMHNWMVNSAPQLGGFDELSKYASFSENSACRSLWGRWPVTTLSVLTADETMILVYFRMQWQIWRRSVPKWKWSATTMSCSVNESA